MHSPSPIPILRRSLLTGAGEVEGVAVVIDVLRAFTAAACMAHLGVEAIALLADADAVLRLKRDEDYLAVGEVDGRPPPGFDLGNSPSGILTAGRGLFAGRKVAHRTTAGTAGALVAADRADLVILGSYVAAKAIARYIDCLEPRPASVSLVAMGDDGVEVTPDDERCADYLEHLLTGRPYDHMAAMQEILDHECARRFLRGDQSHFPPADVVYCLQRDLFDGVLVAVREGDRLIARLACLPGGRE